MAFAFQKLAPPNNSIGTSDEEATESSDKSFIVHLHGGLQHTVFIALVKIYLALKGAKVKDEAIFGMKHNAPCVPDVWAVYEERIPLEGNRYRKQTTNLIVEIETNATTESVRKKQLQYEQTLAGVSLYVLDLNRCPIEALSDWKKAMDWIAEELPI